MNSSSLHVAHIRTCPDEVLDIRANLFAGLLLVPGKMLRKEVEKVDASHDIVTQLSEVFWVSKALMNQRLRDFMENLT
jgi:Zn-dependent peptidase ImmA (M78 family)